MAVTSTTIDHTTLARLIEIHAVHDAEIIGHRGGWGVVIRCGMTERALATKRGVERIFRKFETLVSYLKQLGISQYNVNAADFDPNGLDAGRERPDASERMRSAFEAKAYNDWVQEKVSDSLADPRPNVPHEEAMAKIQVLIDSKRRKHAGKAAS
jgi:hypothetical protein